MLQVGALSLSAFVPLVAAADSCRADHIDEVVQVAFIYDGDTVRLVDGRKVRLAGINAPEVAHQGKPAEPLGDEARAYLSHLLESDNHLLMRLELDRIDHYGRLLAHLYQMDGSSIEEQLLRKGLAQQLVIPPNVWQSGCYQQVERAARQQRRGLWQSSYYRPITGRPQPDDVGGFHLVAGIVQNVDESRKSLWLTLDSGVDLRIPRSALPLFGLADPMNMVGKRIVARGWLRFEKNRYQLTLRHPSALIAGNGW
jgi:micrococcal nuclease